MQHIAIISLSDAEIHLDVPVNLPQDYLVSYIKTGLQKDITRFKKNTQKISLDIISLFDTNYPIKIVDSDRPFIKNGILCVKMDYLKSKSKIETLKSIILMDRINTIISQLEDHLKIMLPSTNLKKFKTKYYSICTNTNNITYNKTLIEKSHDFITYVITQSVGDFLRYTDVEICNLTMTYVSDWKHCERIWNYEQQRLNN